MHINWVHKQGCLSPRLPPRDTCEKFSLTLCSLLLIFASRLALGQNAFPSAPEFSIFFETRFSNAKESLPISITSDGEEIARLILSPAQLTLLKKRGARQRIAWRLPLLKPQSFVIQARRSRITVVHEDRIVASILQIKGPFRVHFEGPHAKSVRARFQPTAAVEFDDDFMRTDESTGNSWSTVSGRWSLAAATQLAFAASPFRFQALPGLEALCKTGHSFWRDYLFRTAARLDTSNESVGIAFYYLPDGSHFLFRWNAVTRHFELNRISGKQEILAERKGVLEAGQWYRFGVAVCGTYVRCYVDEIEVLRAVSDHLVHGGIGLYALPQERPIDFDDVEVLGIPFEPQEFRRLSHSKFLTWMRSLRSEKVNINPTFQSDRYMQNWAGASAGWYKVKSSALPVFRQTARYFQGFDIELPVEAFISGKLKEISFPGFGIRGRSDQGGISLRLEAGGKLIDERRLKPGTETLSFSWTPAGFTWDGDPKSTVKGRELKSATPELSLSGDLDEDFWQKVRLRPRGSYSYSFYGAPADWWRSTGAWEAYSRWSCRPEWTFFSGTSNHLALIWNKRSFPKDVMLDVYAANPMVTMRPPFYGEVSLNFTICGDGVNPFSGYTLVIGGWNRPVTRLYRKDKVVGEFKEPLIPNGPGEFHRQWFHVQLTREGKKVSAFFRGKRIFEYEDSHPLKGDRVGFWALESDISVAHASIFFSREGEMLNPVRQPDPAFVISEGWKTLDGEQGAIISRHVESGRKFIRLTNVRPGGTFAASPPIGPFDLVQKPVFSFDYRLRPGVKANIYFRVKDDWFRLRFTGPNRSRHPTFDIGEIPNPRADGRWHHVEIRTLAAFQRLLPGTNSLPVQEIRIGLLEADALLAAGLGGNTQGAYWDIADFRMIERPLSPTLQNAQASKKEDPLRYATTAPDDFEKDMNSWESFGGTESAYLFRDIATSAAGLASMMLYKRTHGGVFGARWKRTPFNLDAFPAIEFDYRMPSEVRTGLLLQVGDLWLSLLLTPDPENNYLKQPVHHVKRDDKWRHTRIDLLKLIRERLPDASSIWVRKLFFADQSERYLTGYAGNIRGNHWWLDNFKLVSSGKPVGTPPAQPNSILQTPFVSVIYPDRLTLQDFETGSMQWEDWCEGAVVYAPFGATGSRSARVFGFKPRSYMSTMMWPKAVNLNRYPIFKVDYRFPSQAQMGFAVNLDDFFYLIPFSSAVSEEMVGKPRGEGEYIQSLLPGCMADDKWHTAEINLLEIFQRRFPQRKSFQIRDIRTQCMPSRNPLGTSCDFDNFSLHSRRPGKIQFVWQTPSGSSAVSYIVDANPVTVPDHKPEADKGSLDVQFGPGRYYFHFRSRSAGGKWGEPVHVAALLE